MSTFLVVTAIFAFIGFILCCAHSTEAGVGCLVCCFILYFIILFCWQKSMTPDIPSGGKSTEEVLYPKDHNFSKELLKKADELR